MVHRCQDRGAVVYHVQSAAELDPQWFESIEAVGLTAGTSTLPETIEDVYTAISSMGGVSRFATDNSPCNKYPRKINTGGQSDAA